MQIQKQYINKLIKNLKHTKTDKNVNSCKKTHPQTLKIDCCRRSQRAANTFDFLRVVFSSARIIKHRAQKGVEGKINRP